MINDWNKQCEQKTIMSKTNQVLYNEQSTQKKNFIHSSRSELFQQTLSQTTEAQIMHLSLKTCCTSIQSITFL